MDKIEMQDNQKMTRVLYLISPEQKILMERLSKISGNSESELIRQAINMLMGAYSNALKGNSDATK